MSKGLYPIRTVSATTGVNPVTLRAWERRHGLIRPQRTAKGHRLYTEQDMNRIRQILGLLERGIPISQVHTALDGPAPAEEIAATAAEPHAADDAWKRFRGQLDDAITRLDQEALDQVCDEALALFPMRRVASQLLQPAYLDRLERGPDAADLHQFRSWLRNRLGSWLQHRQQHAVGPRILAAATACDELPLLFLALEALNRGYRVTLLGGHVPVAAIGDAAETLRPDAVLVWGRGATAPADFTALGERLGCPLLLGGCAARWHCPEAQPTPLEGELPEAAATLDRTLLPGRASATEVR